MPSEHATTAVVPVAEETKEKTDNTARNAIIAVFVLGAVAGQVLVARRNAQVLKQITKRKGVKLEPPPKGKHDDDWW